MTTEVIKVDPDWPDPAVIKRAGAVIRGGGLVAFPTETVYGLGGDALNEEASGRIYAAKGRPSDNPLIVHIADRNALAGIAMEIPEAAEKLADAFWPGPLTLIFRKTKRVPYATSGGLDTVAVRMPADPVAADLIRASGGYIAAPSANASGRPSPTAAEHVYEDLNGRIPLILDGGPSEIGLESTIVDLTEETPVILRPGFITRDMLAGVIGDVKMDPGLLADSGDGIRPKAPGMRYRHYAPRAPLTVVEGAEDEAASAIVKLAREAEAAGRRAGILAAESSAGRYRAETGALVRNIGSRSRDETIARHLFSALREFDAEGVDVIYSEAFDTPRLGTAIMNRLLKAAGHQVVRAQDAGAASS
ncbi:MAG: L-threonylcarbamoyladenylate synthase [Lachnospiraceae bacterium]|nr:L-threonylcarbamoyladenylate synthase [Lachnospiraceae bacterium]